FLPVLALERCEPLVAEEGHEQANGRVLQVVGRRVFGCRGVEGQRVEDIAGNRGHRGVRGGAGQEKMTPQVHYRAAGGPRLSSFTPCGTLFLYRPSWCKITPRIFPSGS